MIDSWNGIKANAELSPPPSRSAGFAFNTECRVVEAGCCCVELAQPGAAEVTSPAGTERALVGWAEWGVGGRMSFPQ